MSTGMIIAGESRGNKPNGELAKISALADDWTACEVLRWALFAYHPEIAIASAFGAEGVALIDMAVSISPDVRIFTLDTDFLFPETYNLAARIEERYKVRVEWVHADLTPAQQTELCGPDLWRRDPDQCCRLRKVNPLKRKVQELEAWITAIRRDQTNARSRANKVEWDHRFGLVKINPLADWSSDQVWRYIHEHQVPYNPLHDKKFPSIGCVHCTRAIEPDEDPRAGRWAGTRKKECGLHECVK